MRYFRQWSAPPRTKWAMCRGWRAVMSSRGHDRRWSTEMAPRTRSNDAMPSSLREVLLLRLGPHGGPSQPQAGTVTTRATIKPNDACGRTCVLQLLQSCEKLSR
jgi:hypothetical protein